MSFDKFRFLFAEEQPLPSPPKSSESSAAANLVSAPHSPTTTPDAQICKVFFVI